MIASVSDDASLVLWDTNARRSVHQFTRSHKAPATDLSYSPSNDKLLTSCGLDKRIVLYDVLSKRYVRGPPEWLFQLSSAEFLLSFIAII